MEKILNKAEIETYIPHRFENVLLDKIILLQNAEKVSGEFEIQINNPDQAGRQIFAQHNQAGKETIMSPFFMEILALASIVCTGQIPANHLAFFAGIANFKKEQDFFLGEPVSGTVTQVKNKGGFYKYNGVIKNSQGNLIASGDLMAFIVDISNGMPQAEKKKIELPKSNIKINLKSLNNYKDSQMFLADELFYLNLENGELITNYTYPKTHPLTRGHFPNNSVMMGVMQWLMVEDAGFVLAQQFVQNGKRNIAQIIADAQIVRTDGVICSEIKDVKMKVSANGRVEIYETAKIAFKEIVYPNDTLQAYLQNVRIIA